MFSEQAKQLEVLFKNINIKHNILIINQLKNDEKRAGHPLIPVYLP